MWAGSMWAAAAADPPKRKKHPSNAHLVNFFFFQKIVKEEIWASSKNRLHPMASIKKMREKKNSAKVWRRIIKNLVKIFLLFSGCPLFSPP